MTRHFFSIPATIVPLHVLAVNHEPTRTLRYGMTEKDDAQTKYRADSEGQPPSQADGHNSRIEQHDVAAGANGRPIQKLAVNDEINASA